MLLIYNNDEFSSIIISVYISVYDIMNIDTNIIKQLFKIYISRNSKIENIILINNCGFSCNCNYNDDEFYKNYAYNILENNLLIPIIDKLKIMQNLKNLINDINDMTLTEIYNIMSSYIDVIKYYCNKKIYINYINKLESINNDKKYLIYVLNETFVSFYNFI